MTPKNDRNEGVTKFCLAMEEHRRTDSGRVRTAKDMVAFFFPCGIGEGDDRLFVNIPPAVRGPVIATWGIRGPKTALRDSDEKVRVAVEDAMASGDLDEHAFENGITAQMLVDWVDLQEFWSFWRGGKLTMVAIQKVLATARELGLFDDKWFFEHVEGRGGRLKGSDTICDTLTKDQVVAWIRKIHASGDGSPAGMVAALGWDTILAKTSQEALLFAVDAFAQKVGLVAKSEQVSRTTDPPTAEDEGAATASHTEMPAANDVAAALDDGVWGDDENGVPRQSGTHLSNPPVHVPTAKAR